MRLDPEFSREIAKISNGDGSRDAMFAFKKVTREVALKLSNTKAPSLFGDCIKTYGRVPVAVCVAVTIFERRDSCFLRIRWVGF